MTAAAKISRLAVGDPAIGLDRVTYRRAGRSVAGGARRRPAARHSRRHDRAAYVSARRGVRPADRGRGGTGSGSAPSSARGAEDLDVTIDGVRDRRCRGRGAPRLRDLRRGRTRSRRGRRPALADRRRRRRLPRRGRARRASRRSRSPARSMPTGPGDTPSRRRLLVCRPRRPPMSSRAREDSQHARHTRLSASGAGHRTRHGDAARVLPRRARGRDLRDGHTTGADARARRSAVPVPVRARAGQRRGRRRRSGSAISSWRRASRSSCGAACRTTS